MEVNRSLSDEVDEMNLRLTCVATPTTDEVKLVYNAKQLDQLRDRILSTVPNVDCRVEPTRRHRVRPCSAGLPKHYSNN